MRVRFFAGAADAAGREEESRPGTLTLGELRRDLEAAHGPEFAEVLGRCSVMIDGRRTADETTIIADSATVDVLPPFAGG